MNISNTILQYTNNLHKEFDEKLDKAIREGANREYIQVLSELVSFISSLKKFLNNASLLDNLYSDIKSGRVCFQWFYTEDKTRISLVRFNPLVTTAYDGTSVSINFNGKGISIHGNTIEYYIDSLKETLSLNEINNIMVRKSLLLNVLGTLKTVLQHYMDDFIKCSKMSRSK